MSLIDLEREQARQANGRMILQLCELGSRIVDEAMPKEPTPAERCGMTEASYKYAESLYLHGDLSGR